MFQKITAPYFLVFRQFTRALKYYVYHSVLGIKLFSCNLSWSRYQQQVNTSGCCRGTARRSESAKILLSDAHIAVSTLASISC